MNESQLRELVQRMVLCEAARGGNLFVPVMTSARHAHLSPRDIEGLFGAGYRLTKLRDLAQPGQYVCREQIVLETPKARLSLRVIGPARNETQVELSVTDGFTLGITPTVRMSGDLADSPGCVLSCGDRRIEIGYGVIASARHVHLSAEEAALYGVRDGDTVSLEADGPRAATLRQVIVRCGQAHLMEAHIDTDEANACGIRNGQLCRLIKATGSPPHGEATPAFQRPPSTQGATSALPPLPDTLLDISQEKRRLLTERDVRDAAGNGFKRIRYAKDAIVTPLARDMASDKGVELFCADTTF